MNNMAGSHAQDGHAVLMERIEAPLKAEIEELKILLGEAVEYLWMVDSFACVRLCKRIEDALKEQA